MILFFDTSALVKFFHREEGTDVVVSIISGLKRSMGFRACQAGIHMCPPSKVKNE